MGTAFPICKQNYGEKRNTFKILHVTYCLEKRTLIRQILWINLNFVYTNNPVKCQ